jgi:hypothetical protein
VVSVARQHGALCTGEVTGSQHSQLMFPSSHALMIDDLCTGEVMGSHYSQFLFPSSPS